MFRHSMFGVIEVQYFGVRSKTTLKAKNEFLVLKIMCLGLPWKLSWRDGDNFLG